MAGGRICGGQQKVLFWFPRPEKQLTGAPHFADFEMWELRMSARGDSVFVADHPPKIKVP